MSSNRQKIRKALEEILTKLNSDKNSSLKKSSTTRESNLYSIFSELLIARDESLANFDNLIEERLNLYISTIFMMYINKINNKLQENNALINFFFYLGKIVSNEEYIGKISQVLYYANSEITEIDSFSISSYFFQVYEKIKTILYEDQIEVEFEGEEMTISIDPVKTINFNNLDDQEYEDKILFLIRYLSELKSNSTPAKIRLFGSRVNKYSEFLSGDGEGSLISLIGGNVSEYLGEIEKSIITIKFINNFMKEKDPNYNDVYIVEIISLYDSLSEIKERLSELSVRTIKILENIGDAEKFTSIMLEIDAKSREMTSKILDAIKTVEVFLQDYSPFIGSSRSQSERIARTIEILEGIDFSTQNVVFDPFKDFVISGKEYRISEWIKAVIDTKVIDSDIFSLILMIAGIVLSREDLSEDIGEEFKSYAFLTLLKKNLILEEFLKAEYKEKRDMERDLVKTDKIGVKEYFNNEKIPFIYKNFLPKLEVLDYIDFIDIKHFSATPPANSPELQFRENVRIQMLEAFAKQKAQLSSTIVRMIDSINYSKGDTLKSLYMELCFREVVELFLDYIEDNSDANIDNIAKEAMEKFSNATDKQNLISRITKYLSVWNYFYNQEYDLIENALVDGDLKDLLE